MTSRTLRTTAAVTLASVMLAFAGFRLAGGGGIEPRPAAPPSRWAWLQPGRLDLQSADVLTFGPDGLLFVGDSRGSAVYAVDVGDSGAADSADVTIPAVDARIAARLGVTPDDISIRDMAVHPMSHNVYFAVTRGRGRDAPPALIRVSHGGHVEVLALTSARFARAELPRPLPADSVSDQSGRNWTISDMAVMDSTLFVAGLSNEEFSSTMRRLPIPFTGRVEVAGLRLYHTHHWRYETQAPATAITPYDHFGRKYLIASYGCTPIVLFRADSLRDGAKVTGRTIAELGAGQNVRDLVVFSYDGRRYLAVNNRRRSLQLLDASSLPSAPTLTEGSPNPVASAGPLGAWMAWGLTAGAVATQGVLHLADFDASHSLAVQRDIETGSLNLRPLNKPLLWP